MSSSYLQSLFDFIDICRVVKPNTYRLVSGLCHKMLNKNFHLRHLLVDLINSCVIKNR